MRFLSIVGNSDDDANRGITERIGEDTIFVNA